MVALVSRLTEFHLDVLGVLAFSLAGNLFASLLTSSWHATLSLAPHIVSNVILGCAALWLAAFRRRNTEQYWLFRQEGPVLIELEAYLREQCLGDRYARLACYSLAVSAIMVGGFATASAFQIAHHASVLAQLTAQGVVRSASFFLLCSAFLFHYRVYRFFNLGQAAYYLVGAYSGLVPVSALHGRLGAATACVVGSVCGASLALFAERLILVRLLSRGVAAATLFLASVGIYYATRALCALIAGPALRAPFASAVVCNSFVILTSSQIAAVLAGAFVLVVASVLSRRRVWLVLEATIDDVPLAEVKGIDTERVQIIVTLATGAIVGVAGSLAMLDVGVTPWSGLGTILFASAIGLAVGRASLTMLAAASLCCGLLLEYLQWMWSQRVAQIVLLGAAVILLVLLRPRDRQ